MPSCVLPIFSAKVDWIRIASVETLLSAVLRRRVMLVLGETRQAASLRMILPPSLSAPCIFRVLGSIRNSRDNHTKKNIFAIALLTLAQTTLSAAAASGNPPQMPRTLANARFVYVAAYDGDQFDPNLLPDDRAAIG